MGFRENFRDKLASGIGRWPRLAALLRLARYSLRLLLEGRLWVFLLADLVLLVQGLIQALVAGGRIDELYAPMVIVPSVLLAAPALSAIIALERRAGSLDLALATPQAEGYFLRRAAPVALPLLAQGWLILCLAPSTSAELYRPRALVMSVELMALVVALVIFWAVRLKSAGGVLVATWASLLLLRLLFRFSPEPVNPNAFAQHFFGFSIPMLAGLWNIFSVGFAALIVYLFARQRLRRPESMLL